MSRKTKKILSWIGLFLAVTAATCLIGQKTDGFTKNPFEDEDKQVEVDSNADSVETENTNAAA